MALDYNQMAAEAEAEIRTALSLGAGPLPKLTSYLTALSKAIVEHIQNNAEVAGTASPSGDTVEGTIS